MAQYEHDDLRIRERFVLPENANFYYLYENRNESNIGELINEALYAKREQQKIASILKTWDLTIQKLELLIEKKQKFKKAQFLANRIYSVLNGGILLSGYTNQWNTEKNTITISEGGNSCGFVNFNKEKFWSGGHCYALLNVKIENNFIS